MVTHSGSLRPHQLRLLVHLRSLHRRLPSTRCDTFQHSSKRHPGRRLPSSSKSSRTKTCIVTRSRTSTKAHAPLFGRVRTYELMESRWRAGIATRLDGTLRPDDQRAVVTSTLEQPDWNGNSGTQLLARPFGTGAGKGVFVRRVQLPVGAGGVGLT